MNLLLWSMMVLCLCSSTGSMVVDKTRLSSWHSFQIEKGKRVIQHFKRHSDGTFTSDFTNYLDKLKAKYFVEWLACAKGQGCHEHLVQIAAEV